MDKLNHILNNYVNNRGGLIRYFSKVDEKPRSPRLYRYISVISEIDKSRKDLSIVGSGFSLNETQSKWAAIGEAIERYCARIILKNDVIYEDSFENLSKEKNVLDPKNVTRYLDSQYKNIKRLKQYRPINNMKWVNGKDIINGNDILLPYELIYLSHQQNYIPFREIISTGLACGPNPQASIISGLNECIERDAFVIFWIFKRVNFKIDIDDLKKSNYKNLFLDLENNDLEVEVYDITQYDIGVPTILTLVKNKNRKGFYYGCASNFNYRKAIIKSIEEGIGGYSSYIENLDFHNAIPPRTKSDIYTLDDHCLYYINGGNDEILLEIINRTKIKQLNEVDFETDLSSVLNNFKKLRYNIICKELTTIDIEQLDLCVYRVVTPELAFLSLGPPMLNSKRIELKKQEYNKKINMEPHPFP
ncbi:YcaO-like family protein [Oceanobacillus oncorhynchi]|uniref:YcaO-like family protein n=1 Tax=Oceanobacillus oncorhynchi TaxID=545501 RepID=UPI001867836B|nr:YcaO-like family protein [Oceanobacillus oncorhynchi]